MNSYTSLSDSISSPISTSKHSANKLINNIKIQSQIGGGPSCLVLKAIDQITNTVYALKVYPLSEDGKIANKYISERRFKTLRHPNFVEIIESGDVATFYYEHKNIRGSYILMKYETKGDFHTAIVDLEVRFNEKLARTYFHQLIELLEYLHQCNVCHLDIKPQNILLNDDFQLVLADLDYAYIDGDDKKIRTRGTPCHRAPEIKAMKCQNPELADVYSAGVFLFFMITNGTLPHLENQLAGYCDLQQLLRKDPKKFWKIHEQMQEEKGITFSKSFRKLIEGMLEDDPSKRMDIQEIKKSEWYNGIVYNKMELQIYLSIA